MGKPPSLAKLAPLPPSVNLTVFCYEHGVVALQTRRHAHARTAELNLDAMTILYFPYGEP
jgi:hypothetical protein